MQVNFDNSIYLKRLYKQDNKVAKLFLIVYIYINQLRNGGQRSREMNSLYICCRCLDLESLKDLIFPRHL